MLYSGAGMPIVFVVSQDWLLRAGVRAELRERGIEAIGMESADEVGRALANGTAPSAMVLDAGSTPARDRGVAALAGRVPTILIAPRIHSLPTLPAATILNRPVRIGEVVESVVKLIRGLAA